MAIEIKFVGGSMNGRTRRTRSLGDVPSIYRGVWREFYKESGKPTGRERHENYRLDREHRKYVLMGDLESETVQ